MATSAMVASSLVTEVRRAYEIMGENVLGIKRVIKHFHVTYTNHELRGLALVPFSEETLERCKNTHLLIAGYPMSISQIFKRIPENFRNMFFEKTPVYTHETFITHKKVDLRWYLIRKEIFMNESRLTFPQQQVKFKVLFPSEEITRACELVYAMALHLLVKKTSLLKDGYARCGDLDKWESRVVIASDFQVTYACDSVAATSIGIATSVIPDSRRFVSTQS